MKHFKKPTFVNYGIPLLLCLLYTPAWVIALVLAPHDMKPLVVMFATYPVGFFVCPVISEWIWAISGGIHWEITYRLDLTMCVAFGYVWYFSVGYVAQYVLMKIVGLLNYQSRKE